jgi:hypothetical protein
MFQGGGDPSKITVAWIGIIGSVLTALVALVNSFVTRQTSLANQRDLQKHQHELETLKATLQEQKADKDARRDYEYEARKRLYQQCEPLLFQLVELAENGLNRIYSLARAARSGDLSLIPNEGWLSDTRNYYLASTVHKLIAPLVVHRLIQRRLTLVDLTVDTHINSQYLLAKRLFISFTDDFEFARAEPTIEYDPNAEVPPKVENTNPEKYMRQAMFIGSLESLVDRFIVSESDGSQRCMTYGEFETVYYQDHEGAESFHEVAELFHNFHPKSRPVLWRILIAQAHIYEALIRTRQLKLSQSGESVTPLLIAIPAEEKSIFDWRDGNVNATDDEVLIQPFDVSQKYLRKYLGAMFEIQSVSR